MPNPIDLDELNRLLGEIERLEGGGPQAIASKYLAQTIVSQTKATLAAKRSADRFGLILAILTAAIVALTIVLIARTH